MNQSHALGVTTEVRAIWASSQGINISLRVCCEEARPVNEGITWTTRRYAQRANSSRERSYKNRADEGEGGRRNGMMEKSAELLSGLFNWQRERVCVLA